MWFGNSFKVRDGPSHTNDFRWVKWGKFTPLVVLLFQSAKLQTQHECSMQVFIVRAFVAPRSARNLIAFKGKHGIWRTRCNLLREHKSWDTITFLCWGLCGVSLLCERMPLEYTGGFFFCWFLDTAIIVIGFVNRHLCSVLKLLFMSSKKCADKKKYLFCLEIVKAFLHLNGSLDPGCSQLAVWKESWSVFTWPLLFIFTYREHVECQCLLVPFFYASLPATFVPKQMNHDGNRELL